MYVDFTMFIYFRTYEWNNEIIKAIFLNENFFFFEWYYSSDRALTSFSVCLKSLFFAVICHFLTRAFQYIHFYIILPSCLLSSLPLACGQLTLHYSHRPCTFEILPTCPALWSLESLQTSQHQDTFATAPQFMVISILLPSSSLTGLYIHSNAASISSDATSIPCIHWWQLVLSEFRYTNFGIPLN